MKIRRTDLMPDVLKDTYDRMNAERFAEAAELRAVGEAQATRIKAEADRQAVEVGQDIRLSSIAIKNALVAGLLEQGYLDDEDDDLAEEDDDEDDGDPARLLLTAEGVLDWVHWGRSSRSDVNRKASAAVRIGDYERLDPSGPRANRMNDGRTAYAWSDGTPQGVDSGTTTGIFFTADGYRIRVPADTAERTVSVYLGGWNSSARFTATLSDGSAPAVSFDASDGLSNASVYDKVVTLSYSAASASAELILEYELISGSNITLQAVTLRGAAGSVNTPPRFDSSPVESVVAGTSYQYSVQASDADAGDVLILSALTTPAVTVLW